MRLTCPNCGAQYAVDPRVIPAEGRDVQCSSCGHTWFQLHPDSLAEEPEPPVEETLPSRSTDPEVMSILREEAARERAARAAEGGPLESQGELDVTPPPPPRQPAARPESDDRPAGEATSAGWSDRTVFDAPSEASEAPEVPEVPDEGDEPEAARAAVRMDLSDEERGYQPAPRRALLPDIEEINSTLSPSEMAGGPGPVALASRRRRENRGRRIGFAIAMLLFALLTILYVQGPRIAVAVPAFAPAMRTYVGAVNSGRIWLDGVLRQAVSADAPESGSVGSTPTSTPTSAGGES